MTKPQPTAEYELRDPLANLTPEQWRKAREARDMSELEAAARNGFKPAIEELARMKAKQA